MTHDLDQTMRDQDKHAQDTMLAVQELKDETIAEAKEAATLVQTFKVESIKGITDLQEQVQQEGKASRTAVIIAYVLSAIGLIMGVLGLVINWIP